MATKLPLDALSSIVMISNVEDDDLLEVYGPLGPAWELKDGLPITVIPARSVHRLYCRAHLLLLEHRKSRVMCASDIELDVLQQMLAQGRLERLVRLGELKLFAVRRPSTKTWDQCPHCRWKERNSERLRNAPR